MATNVTLNGTTYSVPASGERNWASLSSYLIALSTGVLTKAGGSFTLTAEVNFGATYGLKTAYVKSQGTNVAAAGVLRLANTETISWRNNANSADIALTVSSGDRLQVGGVSIPTISSADILTNKTIDGDDNTVQDLPVTSIKTVLADANKAVVRDASGVPTSALIVNANIDAAAAIARSKVAAGTASHVLVNDGSGNLSSEAQLDKTRGGTGISSTATFPSSGTVVTRDASETLENKTLTSPVVNTPTVDVMTLDGQASPPSNPSAGNYKTYVSDDDGKLHIRNSDGSDVAVGSGSSGRNYLSDWFDSAKAESVGTSAATSTGNRTVAGNTDPTKWVTSDLTNLTFTRSADTTLRQSYNYLINSGDATADFVESPLFTLDGVDLGKPVTVSFDCAGVSASDDYQVVAVRYNSSGTYQEVIPIAGTASATSPYSARIPTGTTKFQGFFIAGSTATDMYAIRFMKHAVNVDLRIDSLYVGPEKVVQGAAVTDPVAFTPESNLSTNVILSGFYCREGAYMVGEMSCEFTGANTQNVSMYLAIPTSIGTVDTSKTAYSQDGNSGNVCLGLFNDDSGSVYQVMGHWNNNQLYCYVQNAASTYTTHVVINPSSNIPVTIADDDFISIKFRVPIVGWSSNITMADRAVEEYASNSGTEGTTIGTTYSNTSYCTNSIQGSIFPNITSSDTTSGSTAYIIQFPTPTLPTDNFFLEFSSDSGASWSDMEMYSANIRINDTKYGVAMSHNTTTTMYVSFGRGGVRTGATYGAASPSAWSTPYSANYRWRVRKVSGGAAVGYPISARNIVGDTSGTAVPAGLIGQIVSADSSGAVTPTTGQYTDGGNAGIAVTKGTWIFYVRCGVSIGSMSALTRIIAGISTSSGYAFADANSTNYQQRQPATHTPSGNWVETFTSAPILVTADATYYPKFYVDATVGTATVNNYIRAVRIA